MWAAEKDRIAEGESATWLGTCGNLLPDGGGRHSVGAAAGNSGTTSAGTSRRRGPRSGGSSGPRRTNYCGFFSVARNWMATDGRVQAGPSRCPLCGCCTSPGSAGREVRRGKDKLYVIEADEQSVAEMQELPDPTAGPLQPATWLWARAPRAAKCWFTPSIGHRVPSSGSCRG
jgi:hypothetical protein